MTVPDDAKLLARAAAWSEHRELDELTPKVVRQLTAQHGIDFTTALLYDRVINSARHGTTIAAIDAAVQRSVCNGSTADDCSATTSAPPSADYLVGIVPGAFYVEAPESGADGSRFIPQLRRLGRRCELICTESFGSPETNGNQLRAWLAAHREERVVLVSLSKGGADVKHALAQAAVHSDADGTPFANVVAWINVSGILDGSPLVRWLVDRPWRAWPVRAMFRWQGYRFSVLRELEHGVGTPLDFPLRLPAHLRTVHVVGFPTSAALSSKLAERGHRRMTPSGPNDAVGITLADACRWPGTLYPVWKADHYLRAPGREMGLILERLLDWLDDELAGPTESASSHASLSGAASQEAT